MIGADRARHLRGIAQLAEAGLLITNRKRLHWPTCGALDDGGDGARIHPAAQEHTERNIAPQAHSNGLFQAPTRLGDPAALIVVLGRSLRWNVPISFDLRLRLRF